MLKINFSKIILFYFISIGLCSCQYQFAPHPTYLGESFYVDTVANHSAYPWLGPELQKALTLELIQDRSLKMVQREHADLIFSLNITKVEKSLRELDENSQVSESQFVIHVDSKIKTPRELYKSQVSNLSYRQASATYRPISESNLKNTPKALLDEKEASQKAIVDVAKAILINFVERSPSRFNEKLIEDLKHSNKSNSSQD